MEIVRVLAEAGVGEERSMALLKKKETGRKIGKAEASPGVRLGTGVDLRIPSRMALDGLTGERALGALSLDGNGANMTIKEDVTGTIRLRILGLQR